jgi:hypothetical protein
VTATAWAIGGGALVVVGLGITVAVLGLKLGAARAGEASLSARLLGADAKIGRLTADRDQALAELANVRARAAAEAADLKADLRIRDDLLAKHLPPDVARQRLRDALSGKDET